MEDMTTTWYFANFFAVFELLHTDDALSGIKLVDFFILFLELEGWNQLFIFLDQSLMGHLPELLSIFSAHLLLSAHLIHSSISFFSLPSDVGIGPFHCIFHIDPGGAKLAAEA